MFSVAASCDINNTQHFIGTNSNQQQRMQSRSRDNKKYSAVVTRRFHIVLAVQGECDDWCDT